MSIIPLNNQTMGFSLEAFEKIQKENAEYRKSVEERKKLDKKYNEAVKPFTDELASLRADEVKKLLSLNEKFIRMTKVGHDTGTLTKDYHIQRATGGCGFEDIDLVYEYGSKEYKNKYDELILEIRKIQSLIYKHYV